MAGFRDPVCNMLLEESEAAGTSEYEGRTYYFCSEDCQAKFEQNPKEYVPQPTETGHATPTRGSSL